MLPVVDVRSIVAMSALEAKPFQRRQRRGHLQRHCYVSHHQVNIPCIGFRRIICQFTPEVLFLQQYRFHQDYQFRCENQNSPGIADECLHIGFQVSVALMVVSACFTS